MLDILAAASGVGMLVVWVAYPALIGAIGALMPRRRSSHPGVPPFVSIVVASRDDAEAIASRVENCFDTTYDRSRLEVIVALDRGRSGGEPTIPATIRNRVRVVPGDAPGGKAATLNAGVRAARGEILVFTDTHQRFQLGTISRLVSALQEPGVGIVSGSLRLPRGGAPVTRAYWAFERWLRRAEARVHSSVGVTGAVYAMPRALWTPLPPALLNDDLFVPMRLVLQGFRVGFAEAAFAEETRRVMAGQEYTRKVRTLTGVVQLCAWNPRLLHPVRNPIWLQFVIHKLLRLLTPYWLLLLLVWSCHRGFALLGGSAPLALTALGALGIWTCTTRNRWGVLLKRVAIEGTLLQAAVVTASLNGLRGRWRVWNA